MTLTSFDDGLPVQTPGTDIADFASNLSSNVEAVNQDDEAALAMELAPPPIFTDQGMKYEGSDIHGSDSGLGTEPPTATDERPLGEAAEYFAMTQAEGIGAGH